MHNRSNWRCLSMSALLLQAGPVVRHQGWRIHPRYLHERILEPVVCEVRVLCDDELKSRHHCLRVVEQDLEQVPCGNQVRVLCLLHELDVAGCRLIGNLRGEVHLRWLVEHQEAWDRDTVLVSVVMHRQQCGHVIREPVGATTRPLHGHRIAGPLNHNREVAHVQPKWKLPEERLELAYERSHR